MQDLTEYQKAALQVMGIPVWQAISNDEPVKPAAKAHSLQWLNENAEFVADIQSAIEHIQSQSAKHNELDLQWFESDAGNIKFDANKVYAPLDVLNLTGSQKQQLWLLIQQSFSNAN